MKRIISTTLIAIILSTVLVDTINASAAPRRVVRRQGQGQPAAGRRLVRRKRNLPVPTGKATPRQVTQAAKQAEIDAKKLQADAQKRQAGKAPETTVVNDVRRVEANIETIEQQLANLRTWSGDVLPGGYSLAEKNKAQDIAAPYIKESEALKQRVKINQDKIALITTKTWFGFGAPKVNPGKQEEYDRYKKLIAIDEIRLAKLAPIIAQQEVIMGTARSNAVKAAYAGMAIAAMTIGADYLSGGALSTAATNTISSIYSTVAYYTPTPIVTAATQLRSYFTGTKKIDETGTEQSDESILQTILIPMAQTAVSTAWYIARDEAKKTIAQAFRMGVKTTTNTVLKALYQNTVDLANDPNSDPKALRDANKKLQAKLDEMKKAQAKQ